MLELGIQKNVHRRIVYNVKRRESSKTDLRNNEKQVVQNVDNFKRDGHCVGIKCVSFGTEQNSVYIALQDGRDGKQTEFQVVPYFGTKLYA